MCGSAMEDVRLPRVIEAPPEPHIAVIPVNRPQRDWNYFRTRTGHYRRGPSPHRAASSGAIATNDTQGDVHRRRPTHKPRAQPS